MLAFWLARAQRLRRCGEPWSEMTPTGAYVYDVRCRRRRGHGDQHESAFGARWS